LVRTG